MNNGGKGLPLVAKLDAGLSNEVPDETISKRTRNFIVLFQALYCGCCVECQIKNMDLSFFFLEGFSYRGVVVVFCFFVSAYTLITTIHEEGFAYDVSSSLFP